MNQVVEIIQRYTKVPEEAITDEARLVEDLGADSLSLYEIFSTLESLYGSKKISEVELNGLSTVGDIKKIVAKYSRE